MRKLLTTTLLVLFTFLGAQSSLAQVSFGIRIGPPPAPRVVRSLPPRPGPEYIWVDGYYYPVNGHYAWHNGYWTRPPYDGAVWVQPRYESGQFYGGYWQTSRGRYEHNHQWDRDHNRDYGHDNGRHNGQR
jgi:hypothetical protein